MPTTDKVLDEVLVRRYEQWSHDFVGRAILDLSKAAAYSERSSEHTDTPMLSEHTLWFIVRSLCNEYDVPYEPMVRRGREQARENS